MTPLERLFLEALGKEPKGRVGYTLTDYEKARPHLLGLIHAGYIKERRLGGYPGFQITPAGRAFLDGEAVE